MSAPAPARSTTGHGGLASRVVVAMVVVTAFVGLAWADATGLGGTPPGAWLLPIAVVVALGAGWEAVRLAAGRGIVLAGWLVPVAAAAIAAAPAAVTWTGMTHGSPLATIGAAAVAVVITMAAAFIVEIVRYAPGAGSLARLSGSGFAATAIGLPLAFMVGLRLLGHPAATGSPLAALVPLVSLVAVVKAGDIAAYAVGSLVGRHRMAPTLSPGKTWEGAAASLAASLVMAWLVIGSSGAGPAAGWPTFGLLVGLAGMAGDLAESLVKRELGAKDSGRSLGGMGGFLDLVDALLLAAPVAWLLWVGG